MEKVGLGQAVGWVDRLSWGDRLRLLAAIVRSFFWRREEVKSPQVDARSEAESDRPISVFEAAGPLIGAVEGPGDLASNPAYMEGFGRE